MEETLEGLFSKIIEENKQRILRICFVYTGNKEDQKDLFQEVALNIWKALPSFRRDSSVDTWVYKICLNICIQYGLKLSKGRKGRVKMEGVILSDEGAGIQKNLEKREKIKMLHACIGKLDDSEKAIVSLFLEDLPYKSISGITGISENYVAVKLGRIKKKLFDCIQIV